MKEEIKIRNHMIVSGICKPLSMLISYIYIPISLGYLGIEKYGAWVTILTIMSWIGYFDIGLGNGLRNKLTESISNGDNNECKIISSTYAIVSLIIFNVAVLFTIIAVFFDWNRIFHVSFIDEDLRIIVILCCWLISINFVLSLCKNILYAIQKASYVSVLELLTQIINLFSVLIVRNVVSGKIIAIVLIYGFSMISVNIICTICIAKDNINFCPRISAVNFEFGKELSKMGLKFFVIQICALILFTTDNFIVSWLYGAGEVTPYSTVNKLYTIIIGAFSAFMTPVWSAVTKATVEKRGHDIKTIIIRIYYLMIPFLVGTVLLAIIFDKVSYIWLKMELNYSRELILFGAMYCMLNIWTNMHGAVANGMNLLNEQIAMAVIQATVNIPLSIILANAGLNSSGILLGTNISLLISCIYLPICIWKKLREGV